MQEKQKQLEELEHAYFMIQMADHLSKEDYEILRNLNTKIIALKKELNIEQ